MAIDVERFMPLQEFKGLIRAYVESIKGSRKAKGVSRIYLPGEIEFEKEKASLKEGIEINPGTAKDLNQLLEKLKSPLRLTSGVHTMKWIVRVNTKTGNITKQEATSRGDAMGRQAVSSQNSCLREVPPTCDPLGRYNKLIIAPGLARGYGCDHDRKVLSRRQEPTDARRQGKRRRRRGRQKDRHGWESRPWCWRIFPRNPATRILTITADQIKLSDYPELKGKQVSETFQILRKKFGSSGGNHLHRPGRGDEDGRGRGGRDRCPGHPGPVCGPRRPRSRHGSQGGEGDRRG